MKRRLLGLMFGIGLLLFGILIAFSFQSLQKYDRLENLAIQGEALRSLYLIKEFWDERKLSLAAPEESGTSLLLDRTKPEDERRLQAMGIDFSWLEKRLEHETFALFPLYHDPKRWSIWIKESKGIYRGKEVRLEARAEKRFSDLLQKGVKFTLLEDSSKLSAAKLFFEEGELSYLFQKGVSFVDIYLPFAPDLYLQVTLDRGFYSMMRTDWRMSLFYLFLSLSAILALFYLFLERLILSKISHISAKVRQIEETHDLSLRIDLQGGDELGELAAWINGMLKEIERFQQRELGKREILLENERRFLQKIIDSWNHALLVMEGEKILKTNDAFKRLFGEFDALSPRERESFLRPLLEAKPQESVPLCLENQCLFFRVDSHYLGEGQRLLTLTDVSRLNEQLQTLQDSAMRDSLTGLLNRHGVLHFIQEHLEKEGFGVLIFDLDHFKKINDTYGHPIGNEVLRGFGLILSEGQRSEDAIGRWGGEEFILVLSTKESSVLHSIAERVRQRLKATAFSDGCQGTFRVSVSIGGAILREGESFEGVYERADKNLYQAKALGRDQSIVI